MEKVKDMNINNIIIIGDFNCNLNNICDLKLVDIIWD